MIFEQHHVEHYRRHGYAIVERFLTAAELTAARAELAEILPGWVEFCDDPSNGRPKDWDAPFVPGRYRAAAQE